MKQNLPPGMEHFYRYATFSTSQDVCQSPLRALQRDISFSPRGSANGDGEIRPIYANQLQQLECLIRTQRDFQKLMKTNYTSLLDKYKNAMSEIELLRKQVTAVNLNRLAQEKTILERKFHEQIRARMVLENRFRTLLQALRAKCSALEKSQKKLLTCEQERNVFKAELEQLKQKNSVLEQRLTDALANQQSSLSHESFNDDEDSTRHSTYYSHNGLIPRKVTIQRSYEALKDSKKHSSSVTRSMGVINTVTSSVVTSQRPSLPINLVESSAKLPQRVTEESSKELRPVGPKSILLNLLVHNSMPSMVSKGLPFGSRCPMQLGTVRLEPKTTWDQLDARVGTILSSFAHKIAEATDGNRFSNVLRSINGTDSLLVSQTCNGQPKLDQSVWKSNVRFELGELQWFMGSPPTHNLLSIYNLQFCSTPFDLCMGLRSSSSSLKTNSSDRSTTEEAQSQLRQEIVLTLDSITEVSMQSGVSTAYLRKYLDAMKANNGLILVANTGKLWATRLLNSLVALFMNELQTTEQRIERHTPSSVSPLRLFCLKSWLLRQNLVRFTNEGPVDEERLSKSVAFIVFDNMEFLLTAKNRNTLSNLLGIPGTKADEPVQQLLVRQVYLLALSNPIYVEWLRVSTAVRCDLGWLVPLNPSYLDAGKQQSTPNALLLHQLVLSRPPLIDVVPLQLRLAEHKVALELEERRKALYDETLNNANFQGAKSDLKDSNPDLGEMCHWIESIWTRLFMCVKWLGLHRTQWLSLDSGERPPLANCLPFSLTNETTNSADETDGDKPLWNEIAGSLITTQLDETTERLAAEMLDPDKFLSFPGFRAALYENTVMDFGEMVKWVECKWNEVFEPGLQKCVLSASSLEPDAENRGPNHLFLHLKLSDPEHARKRVQQALRLTGSDGATSLFLRQIILPDCPLHGFVRSNFISRLTGGETVQPRISRARRLTVDPPETTIVLSENRAFKPNVRMIDESQVLKRALADRSRMRGVTGDAHTADEPSSTLLRTLPVSNGRRKKNPRSEDSGGAWVRTSGLNNINERMKNHTPTKSSGCGSDAGVNALTSCHHMRGESYRLARFRTHSPHRTWSDRSPVHPSIPIRGQNVLLHPVNVKSDSDLICEEHKWS